MKKTLKFGAFIICLITALWLVPKKVSAQNENINLQVFYDELGDYGTWVDNPDYGYVWVPNVDQDFRPYVTNGHWVFTDYGWTWSSDFEWGWAPFHYGRWTWDEQYGNVWVPDTEWGPAWVVWKKSPGYYGWAPMTPGMGTTYNQYSDIPVNSWYFVRDRDLLQYDLVNYFVDQVRFNTLMRISNLIFNTRFDSHYNHNYIFGPDRMEFQRYYGRIINPIHIYDNSIPGKSMLNNNRFSIYRPQFNAKTSSSYRESRPISFIRNKEKINFTPNSYRSGKGKVESGKSNVQYNNNRNSNEIGKGNNQNNNNPNYINRNSYQTGRGNVQNNINNRNTNVNKQGNANTLSNNGQSSNVNGTGRSNNANGNNPANNGNKANPIINGLKNTLSGKKPQNNAANGVNANNNNTRQGGQPNTSGATTGRQGNTSGQPNTGSNTGNQQKPSGTAGTQQPLATGKTVTQQKPVPNQKGKPKDKVIIKKPPTNEEVPVKTQ